MRKIASGVPVTFHAHSIVGATIVFEEHNGRVDGQLGWQDNRLFAIHKIELNERSGEFFLLLDNTWD